MGILMILLVGLIAGALAKFLMPGSDPGGILMTMLIGVAGAFVASFVAGLAGMNIATGDLSLIGILSATAGAFALLFGYRMVRG